MAHIPVLLNESISFLRTEDGRAFIDATYGGGGHTKEILQKMPSDAILIAIDRDENAFKDLRKKFSGEARLKPVCANFRDIKNIAKRFAKTYNGILFDLGMSSDQLEKSGRGFSFQKDEPMLMTYEANPGPGCLTAALIVNTWTEEKLAEIFWKYGEERRARQIARLIVKERTRSRILGSKQLADLIAGAFKKAGKLPRTKARFIRGRHPATKVFQALRITVNDELGVLQEGLKGAWELLGEGGRLVVISFHSLEDRVVKNFFKSKKADDSGKILTPKPLGPTPEEVRANPRSRSAKLRALEKITNF